MEHADSCDSCVTFGLLGAALVPMIMLVNSTPEEIPADVIAEERLQTANGKVQSIEEQAVHAEAKA